MASINGNDVLYHFLQKDLQETDPDLFRRLVVRLILSLGIWFPPAAYMRLPIMLPYAARDPAIRGNRTKGIPDRWGSPSALGVFLDDNTLIKGLPKSLDLNAPVKHMYRGKRMGTGFIAAHVWREVGQPQLASRDWRTYSFIPNVVWLPAQVAKLTDREASFAQRVIQRLSFKLYGSLSPPGGLSRLTDHVWERLMSDEGLDEQLDVSALNYFEVTEDWFEKRFRKLASVVEALDHVVNGRVVPGKTLSSRYTAGLGSLSPDAVSPYLELLRAYAKEVGAL
jgi:hypothetical protein